MTTEAKIIAIVDTQLQRRAQITLYQKRSTTKRNDLFNQ